MRADRLNRTCGIGLVVVSLLALLLVLSAVVPIIVTGVLFRFEM